MSEETLSEKRTAEMSVAEVAILGEIREKMRQSAQLDAEIRNLRKALGNIRTRPVQPGTRANTFRAVMQEVIPPDGIPIEELRLRMRDSSAYKSKRKHMVDFSIRTQEELGYIVIKNYRVYLSGDDPSPKKKTQNLPESWYKQLKPVM